MKLPYLLAALCAVVVTPVNGGPVTEVASATYRPAVVEKPVSASNMHPDGVTVARRVELARPSKTERATKLAAVNGGSPIAAPGKRQSIGFGRDVDAQKRRVDLSALTWTTTADGARVARIEVASLGAAGIRVAMRMPTTHPDVQVRFAGGTSTQAIASVPANTIAQATARFGEYWSPVIDGERAAIEIEAEKGASLAGVTLEIARVSHLVVGPMATPAQEAKILEDIGDAGACNINVKCVDPQDSVTLGAAAGTGKLVFTASTGDTFRCTGTLLNDTITSFTPYVFGANICIRSAYEAFTLNVWWFFDAMACDGSNTPGNYVVQTGGAMLLGRSQDWDWELLRMNTTPPQGVSFRGWNATALPSGSYVEIFHHPSGDLKKWSRGTSGDPTTVDFATAAGGGGLFTPVVWSAGTTEVGSSGGALVSFETGDAVVRGALYGGSALCTNPNGTDYFSLFGAMLPMVRQYITPNFPVAGIVVSVEFYNGNLNHFFMTINPAEIAGLDNGTIVGWERTGFRFLAYDSPGAGRSPVCRFYRKPEFGDSHFFTADPAECQAVAINFATDWVFENPAIYYVQLPNTATGACPVDTKPVYRFLNTSEINHRFTTEQTVAIELSNTPGWTPEGYGPGPLYPVMCSPIGS